jgi:hypothetical protein
VDVLVDIWHFGFVDLVVFDPRVKNDLIFEAIVV